MKRHLLLLTSFVFFLASCTDDTEVNQSIDTAENLDEPEADASSNAGSKLMGTISTPSEVFSIDNQSGRTIKTRNGSRIHIPANAFVTKDGDRIEGDVNFKVMEFNTFGELIASELPMTFTNDNGERVQFESAGMFSLAAEKEGADLALAKDKKINVEYATDVDGPFNFYRMKEDSSGWIPKDTECLPKPNKYKAQLEQRADSLEENKPEPMKPVISYEEGDTLFDIRSVGGQKSQILKLFTGIMWKYIGEGRDLNPNKNRALFTNKYEFVKLEEIDTSFVAYNLSFKTKEEDSIISFPAVPVFQGKLLDRRNEKMRKRLNKIQYATRSAEEIRQQIANEKALLRSFDVDQLGVYNYDVKYKDNQLIPMIADFTFEGNPDAIANVFLIPSSKRIVVRYTPTTFDEFAINPSDNNRMIAILPNNEVYILNNADLNAMNLKERAKESVEFMLNKTGRKVTTAAELDNILADNS